MLCTLFLDVPDASVYSLCELAPKTVKIKVKKQNPGELPEEHWILRECS